MVNSLPMNRLFFGDNLGYWWCMEQGDLDQRETESGDIKPARVTKPMQGDEEGEHA